MDTKLADGPLPTAINTFIARSTKYVNVVKLVRPPQMIQMQRQSWSIRLGVLNHLFVNVNWPTCDADSHNAYSKSLSSFQSLRVPPQTFRRLPADFSQTFRRLH